MIKILTGEAVKPGGWTEEQAADGATQTLIDQVKIDVAKRVDYPLALYKAISFKSQVVNGVNFNVKVQVDTNKYIRIRILQPPGNATPTLEGIQ